MPVKPLPKTLVSRLKRVSPKIDKALGRMKNIDHRISLIYVGSNDTGEFGNRVRQMNVSRNYPRVKLVVKRVHDATAKEVIKAVKENVRNHNKFLKVRGLKEKVGYVLREPIAYDIGGDLVAMAKTDRPSLHEVLGCIEFPRTDRGIQFFGQLSKKYGVTKKQLKMATKQICSDTTFGQRNILLLGVKEGKFVFMPLVDLW